MSWAVRDSSRQLPPGDLAVSIPAIDEVWLAVWAQRSIANKETGINAGLATVLEPPGVC